jgi:hypothetical protein
MIMLWFIKIVDRSRSVEYSPTQILTVHFLIRFVNTVYEYKYISHEWMPWSIIERSYAKYSQLIVDMKCIIEVTRQVFEFRKQETVIS